VDGKKVSCLPALALAAVLSLAGCSKEDPRPPPPAVPCPAWKWSNPLPQGNDLLGVWGSSGTDAYAVGRYGTILHYDGSSWQHMGGASRSDIRSVWGISGHCVFASGAYGEVMTLTGQTWTLMENGPNCSVNAFWGSSTANVYAVSGDFGWGSIFRYDGRFWRCEYWTSPPLPPLQALWGSSPSDVFAVGANETALHFDGTFWTKMLTPGTGSWLMAVWGSCATDVYTCGSSGVILHYDGLSWTIARNHGEICTGIWGSSSNNIYAVGRGQTNGPGEIVHYDGSAWTVLSIPVSPRLNGVLGFSANDVYAVGEVGAILHWNGTSWTSSYSWPNGEPYYAVWATSANDVFAVGGSMGGGILRFDGS
jgi:hypothetical protein